MQRGFPWELTVSLRCVQLIHSLVDKLEPYDCVFQWEVKAPVPSVCFRSLCRQLHKLHEAIVDLLPVSQVLVSSVSQPAHSSIPCLCSMSSRSTRWLFSTILPYSLILADTRCKKWSASLLLYLSRLYSEAKIPLTYESRLMVEYVFKEMTSK